MKPLHYIFRLLALLTAVWALSSCQKLNYTENDTTGEVSFNSQAVQSKQSPGSFQKEQPTVDYAIVEINQKTYSLPVYNLNGNTYTTAIKLTPGNYILSKFLLMNGNQTISDSSDDKIVYATPMTGSQYANFVSHPAGFSFDVQTLNKTEVSVEVLRFKAEDYQKFGFDFTLLPQNTIREQRFDGRFIPNDPNNYSGSLYQSQTNGLQSIMPAIYKINVYRNNILVTSYNNESTRGEQVLTIQYPDDNQTTDQFRFDLYAYVKTGTGFGYRFIHSWEFTDGQTLLHNNDGIVHFVIGNVQNTEANYVFGPVANLPEKCVLTINHGFAPGSLGGYFDGTTTDIATGFSLENSTFPSWCGTDTVSINLGHAYDMEVFSSLTPELLPAYARSATRWNQLNWLINHLNNYSFYDWDILQGAFWMILNDWDGTGHSMVSDANSIVRQMVWDAKAHSNFIPGYGQKAAVIFIPQNTGHAEATPKVQVVFTYITL